MIPDINFVKESFNTFNSRIFGDLLPEPRLKLTRARSFRGKMVYKISRSPGGVRHHDFEMRISLSFDLERNVWEDVVIHEMIHYYIAIKGIRDKSSHGPEFMRLMHAINRNHGRQISVSARTTPRQAAENNADKAIKAHYVCLAKFNDGRLGVAPVAKTRIFELWDSLSSFPDIAASRWVGVTDPWFNTLPHVRVPKFFILKESDVKPHLKGGVILGRRGNRIEVINPRCTPDELLP